MLINVHNLLHVQRSVLQLGPLWANSSFEFEDANGDLKSLFHGSQNIDMQVTTAHTLFPYIKQEEKCQMFLFNVNFTLQLQGTCSYRYVHNYNNFISDFQISIKNIIMSVHHHFSDCVVNISNAKSTRTIKETGEGFTC